MKHEVRIAAFPGGPLATVPPQATYFGAPGSSDPIPQHVRKACIDPVAQERNSTNDSTSAGDLPVPREVMNRIPDGIEAPLTSEEASQVLKIHPKVLERMAKRGEIPALKVGKVRRYRVSALDAWINSRLQSGKCGNGQRKCDENRSIGEARTP